jgi:cytochrome b involved in lipid metabolism
MSAVELVSSFLKLGKKNIVNTERIITLEEVSRHSDSKDCWIVLYDKVYDITKFLQIVSTKCSTLST